MKNPRAKDQWSKTTTPTPDKNKAGLSAARRSKRSTLHRIQRIFRSLGLDIINILNRRLQRKSAIEEKKIALYQDLHPACYHSLLHIIPISTAVALSTLSLRGYYIGGELSGLRGQDDMKFLGLQIAAKLLELMVVSSLSCIVFALLRHQLCCGGIPVGALASGFDFSKISFLWSRELAATCSADFGSRRDKCFLVVIMVVFALLAATVGPAAAVAALPVLRDWEAGGTRFYVDKRSEDMYPTVLDNVFPSEEICTASLNDTCHPSNYGLITEELFSFWPSIPAQSSSPDAGFGLFMPENTILSGPKALYKLAVRFRGPFVFQPDITVATTPLSNIADFVSQTSKVWTLANREFCAHEKSPSFCYYNDIFFSVDALQPISFVRCNPHSVDDVIRFPRLDQGSDFPLVDLEDGELGTRKWFDSATRNGSTTNATWISLPEETFGPSSVGALAAIPGDNSTSTADQIMACAIDARWANASAISSFLGGPLVVSGTPRDWFGKGRIRKRKSEGQLLWSQVKITPDWAQHLDPVIEQSGDSVFSLLCHSIGDFQGIARAQSPTNAVEAIFAVMITEGLSRVGNTAQIKGSLLDLTRMQWARQMLPIKGLFGSGGSAFNYTPTGDDDFMEFRMKATVNGYGYGVSVASILSILVLLTYSGIALAYVLYVTFFSRITSDAWDSITELIALAVNSDPSFELQNTGAGISCLQTLKRKVKVCATKGQLKLVFGSKDLQDASTESSVVLTNTYYE